RVVIDLAEDIKPLEGRHFKTGGVLEDGNDLIRIQDDFIRLIIATQADGHLNKDCSAITFTFVRPDKTLRLKKILNSLGFKYSENVFHRKGRPETSIRVMSSEDTKSIRSWLTVDKQFTSKLLTLPISQRELVIDELKYWDGTVKRNGDIVIDQVGRGSIDILQGLCSITNKKSKLTTYKKTTGFGECSIHRLYISNNQKPKAGLNSCKINTVKYKGYIGCVSVPSSFVLVRRNGKVFISGNTLMAAKLGIERTDAKSVNYMFMYGGSASKVEKMLGYSRDKAVQFHKDWWDNMLPLKQLKEDKEK